MRGIDLYKETEKQSQSTSSSEDDYTLVLKIAKHFKRKLPSHIELNDLIQSGYLGLLEAKKKYRPQPDCTFETFASHRIKGAMIDEMRKNSWGTRESLRQLKLMGQAVSRVEQRLQKAATPEEIAQELNMTPDEFLKASEKIAMAQTLSINVLEETNALAGNEEDPSVLVENDDLKDELKRVLAILPKREQLILSLYYIEELTFRQIAEVLDLTEARICQLHATALAKVKVRLVSTCALTDS